MKRHWMRSAAALLAMTATFAACDDDPFDNDGEPRLSVLLTDAPGDVVQAIVVIDRVSIMADDDENGAVILDTDVFEGDLLDLRNSFVELVDDEEVPVGNYNQIRLRIPEGCIETRDGDVFATDGFDACGTPTGRLQMPSFGSSGLKINLPPEAEVRREGHTIVLLDFDVAESFGHEAGNSNMWVMHPVIHATDFEVSSNLTIDLALADDVTLPDTLSLTDFAISIDDEAGIPVDADGSTLLRYLVSGERTITILPPEGFVITTDPATPYTFDLDADDDLTLEFTITSFAEAPADDS